MRLPLADESSAERTSAGTMTLSGPRRVEERVQRAGAGREHDVVRRDAEGAPDRAHLVERAGDARVVAAAGAVEVQRRRRRRRQQRVADHARRPGQRAQVASPAAAAWPAGRRSRRCGRRSRGRGAGRGSARATAPTRRPRGRGRVRLGVEHQVAELDHGEAVDHAVVRLADDRRRVAGDPHLPQRAVARQRRGEDLVDDVAVGHVEVARGIEVRVVDPHRVVDAERHVGQLLAVAVGVLHARSRCARSAPRRWRGPPSGGSKLATQPTCIGASGLSTARKEASSADRRSGMEFGKPVRLLSRVPAGRRRRACRTAVSAILPFSYLHVPATWPSTRKVGNECGVLMPKIFGRCSSGSTPVRRAWTSSVASQVGRKRGGAGVLGVGQRRAGRRSTQPAVEAAQLEPVEDRADLGRAAGR